MSLPKAIIYCRVSTTSQAEEGVSLETQQKLCTDYAVRNGYEIDKIFIEKGESAKNISRTQLTKLLAYIKIKSNATKAIIIYKLDRLSRNTADAINLRDLFISLGIKLKSVTEHIEDSPVGRFTQTVISANAQLDNEMKAERVIDCMKEVYKKGKWLWPAPIGFKNDSEKSLIPTNEASFVVEAFNLFAKGLYKQSEISEILKAKGFKRASTQRINRILRNPIYYGFMQSKLTPELIKGIHEPLIDESLFNLVSDLLNGRKKLITKHKRSHEAFPLRGLIYCQNCGLKLTASFAKNKMGNKYPYYHCRKKGCVQKPRTISKQILETNFLDYLRQLKPKKELLNVFKNMILDIYQVKQKEKLQTLKKLNLEIDSLKEQKASIDHKFYVEERIPEDVYKTLNEKISADLHSKQIIYLENQGYENDIKSAVNFTCSFMDNVDMIWKEGNLDTKQKIQSLIFPDKVFYNQGQFQTPKISYIYKLFSGSELKKSQLVALLKSNSNSIINGIYDTHKLKELVTIK